MSDSDEDAYVSYGERPEWDDVTPVPQAESTNPVVRIAYANQYVDTMNYFRAVYATGEKSARVLALTEEAISQNGANYTVWHHRWEVVLALGSDIAIELSYVEAMALDNPKNYQVWNHMRLCTEQLGASAARRNLEYISLALGADSKNYHAWSHRQWVVRTFKLWVEDMEFTAAMIDADVRNNSAWNERFFCIAEGGGGDGGDRGEAGRESRESAVHEEIGRKETVDSGSVDGGGSRHTLNPEPQTQNPKPQSLNPKPYTLNPTP
jgi:protein farnesyltransferase/geranylgeranyltransferase type-1 subunit alpha